MGDRRLIISKIVCENFKSYAGRKELGPFHKCFTSIVGPNGSGKSNVIDSILFVFGYRARKIRSKTVSVLIHNSEHHQNLTSCTVSIHFEVIIDAPGEEYTTVPNSQFIVSRTAHKDNSSYYQLNGKRVPFKEISSLLKESGIDLDHNRFLILQGEVEQISLMKPKGLTEHDEGMLEYLEDIIGTSQYKEPIEELGLKVEKINEERGGKLRRVEAAAKEKDALEEAKTEAEHYLSLKKQVSLHHYTLCQSYKHECSRLETQAREKMEGLEGRLDEMKRLLKEHKNGKSTEVKKHEKLLKEYETLAKENDKFKTQLTSCKQRDTQLCQDLKNSQGQLKKTKKALEKEKEKLEELHQLPEKNEKEIKECEEKLKILKKRKEEEEAKLSAVISGLKDDTKDLQKEKDDLEKELVVLNERSTQAKSKFDIAQSELDLYRNNFLSIEKQIEEKREKLQTVTTSTSEKQSELDQLVSSIPEQKRELARSEKELDKVVTELESLTHTLRGSRAQVEEARSSLSAFKNKGAIMTALLSQKNTGHLPGFIGRLGDLGSIDDRYDVAISTACGQLDFMVVDTMDTAVKCVEYLKKANIGTSTFIALDKMEVWRQKATSSLETPEGVPRLFDLVKVNNSKYLTPFYYALRDTLVANDLEQATRIGLQGRKRYRVVTVDGKLIDISGTMSGGGNKVIKGKMSSKPVQEVTPTQLEEMESKLLTEENKVQDGNRRKKELDQKIKELKKHITNSEKNTKTLQRDLEILSEQEKGLKRRVMELEEQKSQSQIDQTKLSQLEKQVKKCQKEYDAAASETATMQEKVKVLHDEIMRIGGTRIKAQQDHVNKIEKELKDTTAVITKCTVAIKTTDRNVKKSSNRIKSLEDDIVEIEERIKKIHEDLSSLEEEAKDIVTNIQTSQDRMKELEEEIATVKADMESKEAEIKEINEQFVDLNHEHGQYVAQVNENKQKIGHFEKEIRSLGLEESDKPTLSEEELVNIKRKDIEYKITMLEETMEAMSPNMAAIEEFKKKEALYNERLKELDEITKERDAAVSEYEGMRKRRLTEFMAGFSVISSKLKEMYQMITLGGDAELELVDTYDPFSEGVVLSVRPPRKSWKQISNLSGGEKTLTSLALVFALHHYKPSPLYVMDEIDAALDYKNVSIVAHYIKERTKNTQFIIISLRDNMYELADRLVGIYKTHDATKSVTIDPAKISMNEMKKTAIQTIEKENNVIAETEENTYANVCN